MLAIVEPVIVPVFMPVQECAGKACNVPGWDWLWILLSVLGIFAVVIGVAIGVEIWLDR